MAFSVQAGSRISTTCGDANLRMIRVFAVYGYRPTLSSAICNPPHVLKGLFQGTGADHNVVHEPAIPVCLPSASNSSSTTRRYVCAITRLQSKDSCFSERVWPPIFQGPVH
jgi:hypothetical protein